MYLSDVVDSCIEQSFGSWKEVMTQATTGTTHFKQIWPRWKWEMAGAKMLNVRCAPLKAVVHGSWV
jgi:hypothetical protein